MNATLVMGIINVTPDSFSGDGVYLDNHYVERALAQAEHIVKDGANILDIGGNSSRPGSVSVSSDEELHRVIPVIESIKRKLGGVPLTIDTVKAEVAEKAVQAGASIVNDISALSDPRMADVVARSKVSVVLMHNRASTASHDSKIGGQYDAAEYKDVVTDVLRDLMARVTIALNAGIARNKIILDPGIGFGKSPEQNLALIAQLGKIKALGFPVLIGPSRKSFIGRILDSPVDERLEGTAACVGISAFLGADFVRVHDVKFMARIVKMVQALKEASY